MLCILCFRTAILLRTRWEYPPQTDIVHQWRSSKLNFQTKGKDTWLKYQGYNYEDPSDFTTAAFTSREQETRTSNTITLIGKIAADFFTCDKHLLSGVTLRLTSLRTRPEFCVIKTMMLKTIKLKLHKHMRKMAVSENVYAAIETALTKTYAMYRYTKIIPKSFLMPQNSDSWNQENIFNGEAIRSMPLHWHPSEHFWVVKLSVHSIFKSSILQR